MQGRRNLPGVCRSGEGAPQLNFIQESANVENRLGADGANRAGDSHIGLRRRLAPDGDCRSKSGVIACAHSNPNSCSGGRARASGLSGLHIGDGYECPRHPDAHCNAPADAYCNTDSHAYAYANTHCNIYTNCYANTHAHCNTYTNCYAHAYADTNCYANSHTYTNCHAYAYAYT